MAALSESRQQWVQDTRDRLMTKVTAEAARNGSLIPFIPINGHYKDLIIPGGLHWWCNGFWPGMLWQLYHAGGDPALRKAAEGADGRLAAALADGPAAFDHDAGFLYLLSSGAEYLCTGHPAAETALLQAADILKGRYQEKGSYILAWNPGSVPGTDTAGLMIADCMMNISLLYIASELTGDDSYRAVASAHADTTRTCLVRSDGSAAHIGRHDPDTGAFLGTLGGQGYGEGSSWARGQGWILYGFTNAYRHTGDARYLETAERSADYCIGELEKNGWLSPVDFRSPDRETRLDASAGMILASGLLSLKDAVTDGSLQEQYLDAAYRCVRAGTEKFADWDPDTDGILGGGSLRYHEDMLDGAYMIYSDYFLTEAVLKMTDAYLEVW